jgi:hypothetical protein
VKERRSTVQDRDGGKCGTSVKFRASSVCSARIVSVWRLWAGYCRLVSVVAPVVPKEGRRREREKIYRCLTWYFHWLNSLLN